ncbi:hypothetical protein HK405_006852, partial [Cladochytrium tenue]
MGGADNNDDDDGRAARRIGSRWPANHWDALPLEVRQLVLKHSSLLTRRLHSFLTPVETWLYAKDIWIEAISNDWSGDLAMLPHPNWAVPTALTGLCTMKSRSIYDRLKLLRPDLADTTALHVFVQNNSAYGNLTNHWSPILLLDSDAEPTEQGGPCDMGRSDLSNDKASGVSCLSRLLIQVAMRNCWIDELQPFLDISSAQVAVAAVLFGHADLLLYLTTHPDPKIHVNLHSLEYPQHMCPCHISVLRNNFDIYCAHCKCCPENDWRSRVLCSAASKDDLDIVIWALKRFRPNAEAVDTACVRASRANAMSVLCYLTENYLISTAGLWKALCEACHQNAISAIEMVWNLLIARGGGRLPDSRPEECEKLLQNALDNAASEGYFNVARRLCENDLASPSTETVDAAV